LLLHFTRASLALAIAAALTACTSGFDAVNSTARNAMGRVLPEALRPEAPAPKLDPRFRYLRATLGGNVAFLALGYEEPDVRGPVEVWYSGTGEVVKLQNGRLDGASGLFTEWRNVDLSRAPTWAEAARAGGSLPWVRTRDVMPGYRYGVEDRMTLRRIATPKKAALQGIDPSRLTWFEETTTTVRGVEVPPAVYGVEMQGGRAQVAYAEQCVAVDFCFTLQRWDPKMGTTDERR
jgi:hypothetical protein